MQITTRFWLSSTSCFTQRYLVFIEALCHRFLVLKLLFDNLDNLLGCFTIFKVSSLFLHLLLNTGDPFANSILILLFDLKRHFHSHFKVLTWLFLFILLTRHRYKCLSLFLGSLRKTLFSRKFLLVWRQSICIVMGWCLLLLEGLLHIKPNILNISIINFICLIKLY